MNSQEGGGQNFPRGPGPRAPLADAGAASDSPVCVHYRLQLNLKCKTNTHL